ncbi:hypothetical protein INT48_007888 [Thamnidium elegans]|uniref:G-protein coupled receptors family 3 profile domain-containing protein n=1 Tax=Thamnidium elegans TaxID=101142 RepID=A0A8H7VW72_9FUNG|nr:hypothetical protein INT48_007888 [Thamnidium elegans]
MNSSADIKTLLKIGLLLPFHNNQTQAAILGGISGARLAAVEINSLEIIPGAIVTLIEKDAYPTVNDTSDMAQAIFSTVSLLQQGVIGVIGDISSSWTALSALMTSTLQIPQCSFSVNTSYKSEYFFRTAQTDLIHTNVILSFITDQKWPSFGILNADTDLSRQLKSYQTFYDTGDTNNIHASIDTLMSFGSRVIVIATKEIDQIVTILTIAAQSGHIHHETVWITMANVQLELQSTISTFNHIVSSRSIENIPTSFKNAIEKTAWTTNVSSIDYKTAFAGGIFTFETETNLTGYLPYDSFYQNKFETEHFNYHTGLAYSCLMTMAHGLGRIVQDSLDRNDTLNKLSTGQLSSNMSVFNQTGFVGPQGPILFDKHGDLTTGNFKIYNFQNGTQVEIGSMIGGNYTLSKSLVYFDGTSQPPSGTTPVTVLIASLTTPISMVTLFLSALGVTAAVIVLIILLLYRNEPVFKSANPLFCALELFGFILSYISIFLFFTYSYSLFSCFMLPITFYISFSVILGTMISRNYSVYRIVNNVYASKHLALSSVHTTVKDTSYFNLFKLTAYILGINTFILALWLTLAKIQLVEASVSSSVSLRSCSYDGTGHTAFIILLSTVTGIELCLCIFLAFQTKSFGGYSKHSEHKQLGVSV